MNTMSHKRELKTSDGEVLKYRSGWLCENDLRIDGRRWDVRGLTKSSKRRVMRLLNSKLVDCSIEFDDESLSHTIYFQCFSVPIFHSGCICRSRATK